jgi:hypothetical protein
VPAGFPDRLVVRLDDTIVSRAAADERIVSAVPGNSNGRVRAGIRPGDRAPSYCRT